MFETASCRSCIRKEKAKKPRKRIGGFGPGLGEILSAFFKTGAKGRIRFQEVATNKQTKRGPSRTKRRNRQESVSGVFWVKGTCR